MKRILWNWIISAAALAIAALLLPKWVHVHNYLNVLWIGPLLGLVSVLVSVLSWLIKLIAFPVNCLTLGCFGLIVSFLLYALALFVLMNPFGPLAFAMTVDGFAGAAALAAVMAVVSAVLGVILPVRKRDGYNE